MQPIVAKWLRIAICCAYSSVNYYYFNLRSTLDTPSIIFTSRPIYRIRYASFLVHLHAAFVCWQSVRRRRNAALLQKRQVGTWRKVCHGLIGRQHTHIQQRLLSLYRHTHARKHARTHSLLDTTRTYGKAYVDTHTHAHAHALAHAHAHAHTYTHTHTHTNCITIITPPLCTKMLLTCVSFNYVIFL